MVLWMRDHYQSLPSAKGLQSDDKPVFFDFEAEEKWRAKMQEGSKKALAKPGKVLEFNRKRQEIR